MFLSSNHGLVQQVKILHVSDLHLGCPQLESHEDKSQSAAQAIRSTLQAQTQATERTEGERPVGGNGAANGSSFHAVVVSGDIIHRGALTSKEPRAAYEEASQVIRTIASTVRTPLERIIVCPGNHDLNRKDDGRPYGEYIAFLNGLREQHPPISLNCKPDSLVFCARVPLQKGVSVVFCSLNSNNDESKGKNRLAILHEAHVQKASALLAETQSGLGCVRIAVLHHGLAPRDEDACDDKSGTVTAVRTSLIERLRVDFCLTGHLHSRTKDSNTPPAISAGRLFESGDQLAFKFNVLHLLIFPYVDTQVTWALGRCGFDIRAGKGTSRVSRDPLFSRNLSGTTDTESSGLQKCDRRRLRDRIKDSWRAAGERWYG